MRYQDHAAELPEAALRHSQPFRRQRFETLVQYICWICEDPRMLGLDRLHRILWYVDRNRYLDPRPGRDRRQLRAPSLRAMGAADGGRAARRSSAARCVVQRARVGDHDPDLLLALAKPDIGGFDPEEISLVEAVTRAICFDGRASIPHRDAHDAILLAARPGEVVPYFTVFAGRPGETSGGRSRVGDPGERAAAAAGLRSRRTSCRRPGCARPPRRCSGICCAIQAWARRCRPWPAPRGSSTARLLPRGSARRT